MGGIALAALAICAVALLAIPQGSPVELIKGDAEAEAGKVLTSQHFKKADHEQRVDAVKSILGKNAKDDASAKLVAKIAKVVADKHETYHERMQAMKELLNSQTNSLKQKAMPHFKAAPKHAASKASVRGRESKADKAAKEAEDNAKAIADGEKLMQETHKSHGEKRLHLSAHDKAIKEETEHKKADPNAMAKWMKKQAEESARNKHTVKKAAQAKIASSKASGSPSTAWAKLLQWAEAHGLPEKLADNPNDKSKVKDIIARMKADSMVEKIRAQFKHDDSMVKDVVHSADPAAAGVI